MLQHLSSFNRVLIVLLFTVWISFIAIIFTSSDAEAIDYQSLAPIKIGGEGGKDFVGDTVQTDDLSKYVNNMFRLGIAAAVALAVLMIIVGGIEYMSTDAIGKKQDGQARINAALLGLVVALGSYMLLNTINPNILNTEFELDALPRSDRIPGLGKVVLIEKGEDGTEYRHYDDNTIEAKHPDGTYTYRDKENEDPSSNPPANAIPPKPPGKPLDEYKLEGCVEATDNGGHKGKISPSVAFLRDNISTMFPGSRMFSHYRSPEWNRRQGGSPHSDHMDGTAGDIGDGSKNMNVSLGNSVVEYLKQNGQKLGLNQIIFRDKNYKSTDGGKTWKAYPWTKGDHNDHVHFGGPGDCN